jgi:hypothetical protein
LRTRVLVFWGRAIPVIEVIPEKSSHFFRGEVLQRLSIPLGTGRNVFQREVYASLSCEDACGECYLSHLMLPFDFRLERAPLQSHLSTLPAMECFTGAVCRSLT